jgi:putative transcriptional regulator
MPISHHLDDATLLSFAAGSLPEALAAVASAHVAVCPVCAAEVRRMEAVGTALFAGLVPMPVQKPASVMAVRRAEADVEPEPVRIPLPADIPHPIAHLVGDDLDAVAWRPLGLGLWQVGPGRRMPEHSHGGAELTLLLRGSYSDETGVYRAGDVSDMDADVTHRPVSDPHQGCICLIASEKPARFKGLIPRMVAPLTGM